jgi:hypothetical protein
MQSPSALHDAGADLTRRLRHGGPVGRARARHRGTASRGRVRHRCHGRWSRERARRIHLRRQRPRSRVRAQPGLRRTLDRIAAWCSPLAEQHRRLRAPPDLLVEVTASRSADGEPGIAHIRRPARVRARRPLRPHPLGSGLTGQVPSSARHRTQDRRASWVRKRTAGAARLTGQWEGRDVRPGEGSMRRKCRFAAAGCALSPCSFRPPPVSAATA